MKDQVLKSCMEACLQCAVDCENCFASCLEEEKHELKRCLLIDRTCADVCFLTAQLIARDSEYAPVLCNVCAEICEDCAQECNKHAHMEHCAVCAASCKRCAEACRMMTL